MAATLYRVSWSTEDIQCSILHCSTGPGRFPLGSLYVVYIYTLDIHCIVYTVPPGPLETIDAGSKSRELERGWLGNRLKNLFVGPSV